MKKQGCYQAEMKAKIMASKEELKGCLTTKDRGLSRKIGG
jgi:hypothetical protein